MFITVIAVIVALALGHLIPVQVAALRSLTGSAAGWLGLVVCPRHMTYGRPHTACG